MRSRAIRLAVAAAAALAALRGGALSEEPAPGSNVDMQWAVKIPMRDGVSLNATIYRPRGQKEALPAVFTLTPYISRHVPRARALFRRARLRLRARRRAGAGKLGRGLRALRQRRPGRPRRRRVAGEAALVRRQGGDVGRLLRRLRPVVDRQGVAAAPRDDRARRRGASRNGFSVPVQHLHALRPPVADVHERRDGKREPVRRRPPSGPRRPASTTTRTPPFATSSASSATDRPSSRSGCNIRLPTPTTTPWSRRPSSTRACGSRS